MKPVFANTVSLGKRLGIGMLCFTVSRLVFLLLNGSHFPDFSGIEFFYGLRFDIVGVSYLFMPMILLQTFPLGNDNANWRKKSIKVLFHVGNTLGLVFNFIDSIYFNFIYKRSTADLFDIATTGNDVVRLIPTYIKDFWYMFIVLFAVIYGANYLYNKTSIRNGNTHSISLQRGIGFLIISALTVVGVRGGTQLKPLTIPDAGKYTSAQNIPVVLNTPFSIIMSWQIDQQKTWKYFEPATAEKLYSPIQEIKGAGTFKGRNVVVIILESFAAEYVGHYNKGKGYTPFLDSLLGESYVFNNNRANGLKSIEALPALFAGIPALDNTPYILSPNSANRLYALPHRLKELGYNTSFYHGGENGTMGFDAFCGLAGIDEYKGLNEYPEADRDYDGNWGIYDEPYLNYFKEELDKKQEPFLSAVFTLSSHHPYSIPNKFEGKFPKGDLEVHETIGYTDYALQQFFKEAQKSDWFKNTLFVITADHPAQSENAFYVKANGKFRVPLAFYDPQGSLKGSNDKLAKHADVPSTVLGLLGDTVKVLNFGGDLFSSEEPFFVNLKSNGFHFRHEGIIVMYNGSEITKVFPETDSLMMKSILKNKNSQEKIKRVSEKGKAYLQQYSNRILKDRLLPLE